jgi:hypothetical protein
MRHCSVCGRASKIRAYRDDRSSLGLELWVWQNLGPRESEPAQKGYNYLANADIFCEEMSTNGHLFDGIGLRKMFERSMSDYLRKNLKVTRLLSLCAR